MPPLARARLAHAAAALVLACALAIYAGARALAAGPAGGRADAADSASAASASLRVTEVEYRLILSTGVIHAGPVNLEAIDRGMDPHDLRLREQGAGGQIGGPLLTPGRRWNTVVDLHPGTYRLWCSLPEHARLGMRATLQVVR